MFGARCERARPVCASTATSGELGVEDVEGVSGDLGDVDAVERRQVPGDDPAVFLERVWRPAPFLHGDPLRGEVAQGSRGRRLIAVGQLDRPAVALCLGVSLPSGPHDTRAVALHASQRRSRVVHGETVDAGKVAAASQDAIRIAVRALRESYGRGKPWLALSSTERSNKLLLGDG
jgi:hypothetical protein